ncbi:hypothetical protein QBC32DRAFT_386241 [Pseudoneurospora amorphoporcata]|uniref:Uncharacterized protein n=1 Tax=Pseudoneurospora amorphoporcata TaxID=241081 RepID=A0AAN6NZH1_9PEZI|nr:hypothetical protein QBC32DRAFT_386241 [Pseudoneurospora amorphoporcata]
MDRLPQEILDPIVDEFARDLALRLSDSPLSHQQFGSKLLRFKSCSRKLAAYSTISRGWQRAIERRLFHTIAAYGASQLPWFQDILGGERNQHRRGSVKSFAYTTYLSPPALQNMTDFVRECQWRLLTEFYQLLTVINDIWPVSPGMARTQPLNLTINIVRIGYWDPEQCDESILTLPHEFATSLPITSAVTSLKIVFDKAVDRDQHKREKQEGRGNQVPPAAWILQPLMAKLPSVDKLSYEMFNLLGKDQFRDRLFTETFQSLSGPLTTNLTELYLHVGPFGFNTFKYTDDDALLPLAAAHQGINNSGEGAYIPRFNSALRELSQQLTVLHITGLFPVHPDLFYPNIKGLRLAANKPQGNKSAASSQSHHSGHASAKSRSCRPSTPVVTTSSYPRVDCSLVVSLTRAMLRMPKLESVEITLRLEYSPYEGQEAPEWESPLVRVKKQVTYHREWFAMEKAVLEQYGLDIEEVGEGGEGVGVMSLTRFLLNDDRRYKKREFREAIPEEVESNLRELSRRLTGLSRFPGLGL